MERNFNLINKSFPEFGGFACEVPVMAEPVKQVVSNNAADDILDAIYAPDPVSKWPTGDYAMLMSEKCSPELRDFIKSQLMGTIPSVESTSGVPDDVLMELTRGLHETMPEYIARMTEYAEQNKLLYYKEQKLNKSE